MCYDAFQVCAMHSDQARASVFAQRGRSARLLCEGEESEEAENLENLALKPSIFGNFGATNRWKSKVEDMPQGLSEESFSKWLWRELV